MQRGVKNVTAAPRALCEAGRNALPKPGGLVSKRNLYEVLEVTPQAAPEVIEAQFQALMQRLINRTNRGHATDLERMALEEAHRTLTNPELRRRDDARITAPAPVHPSMEVRESWFSRNRRMLLLFALLAVCAYGYRQHLEAERAAEVRAQRERDAIAARNVAAAAAQAAQAAQAAAQEQASAGESAPATPPATAAAPTASAPAAPAAEAKQPGG